MPPVAKKKPLFFSLTCGCRDSKSLSVTIPETPPKSRNPKTVTPPRTLFPSVSSAETPTTSSWEAKDDDDVSVSGDSSSSFSGLLRQLSELEQSVLAWGGQIPTRGHPRTRSESGKVGESVAVVKESDDPLTDFRRSMLQMIVEKEIVGALELQELLRRFLALNSREHHDLILRAFTEIWNDVFKGYQSTPDFLKNLRR